jgi:hypothetical protein
MPRLMTPQGTELPHTLVQRYPWVRRHLQSIFEGGPAGQRRAVLLFFFWVAPMALVVGAALSSEHRVAATVLRAVAIGAIVFWLLVRPALRFGEWVLLLIVLTAGNLTAQLAAGVSHNGVFALNSLGIFALVCIVFETQLVVIAAALVEDDGLGFDARAIADARRGFHMGLDSAADRVRSAGGELEITSAPARGTRASFSLPIDHGSP